MEIKLKNIAIEGSNLKNYKQLILDNISQLTKNQKTIAQYLLDYPEEAAFSSIETIAKKLNVGKATIVRLSKMLGYKGFLDLKAELSTRLRNDLSLSQKFKAILDKTPKDLDYITTFANNEIDNIQLTLQQLDITAFNKAIQIFVSAPAIYTMGLGLSSFLAQIAAYFLNRVTMRAKPFTHGIISFQEQIISLNKGDAVLTFSLPPYSIQTIEAAESARINGVKIVTITDKLTAPIVQFSDVVITAKTNNIVFINTISAVLLIIYSLAAAIGINDRNTSLKALSLFEKAKTNFGFDVQTEFFKSTKK